MAGALIGLDPSAWSDGRRLSLRQVKSRRRPTTSAERLRLNSSKHNQIQTKPDQENGLGFSWIPSSDSGLFNRLRAVQIKKCNSQPRDEIREGRTAPASAAL